MLRLTCVKKHSSATLFSILIVFLSSLVSCKKIGELNEAKLKQLTPKLRDLTFNIKKHLKDKELILTFDDGPTARPNECALASLPQTPPPLNYSVPEIPTHEFRTGHLVDFLNFHEVPATFFAITSQYYNRRNAACTIRRIIQSKNLLIANHTWTHTSVGIKPSNCNNTSNIPSPVVKTALPQITKHPGVHESVKAKRFRNKARDIPDKLPLLDPSQKPNFIFPLIDSKNSDIPYVSFASTNPEELTTTSSDHQTIKSPYPGYTKFITNDVETAACLLDQYLLLYAGDKKRIEEYPLFYRPPGGFWGPEDAQELLNHPSMDPYIGPVGWHYGGQLTNTTVADWECWPTAQQWLNDPSKRESIEGYAHPKLIANLKKVPPNPIKGCAEAYLDEIESQPEGERKGIVLFHDNAPEAVKMFIEYLHPMLVERDYTFIGLDEAIDRVEQAEEKTLMIRQYPIIEKKAFGCMPAKDLWCAGAPTPNSSTAPSSP